MNTSKDKEYSSTRFRQFRKKRIEREIIHTLTYRELTFYQICKENRYSFNDSARAVFRDLLRSGKVAPIKWKKSLKTGYYIWYYSLPEEINQIKLSV